MNPSVLGVGSRELHWKKHKKPNECKTTIGRGGDAILHVYQIGILANLRTGNQKFTFSDFCFCDRDDERIRLADKFVYEIDIEIRAKIKGDKEVKKKWNGYIDVTIYPENMTYYMCLREGRFFGTGNLRVLMEEQGVYQVMQESIDEQESRTLEDTSRTFVIPMTKRQFERVLDKFVNDKKSDPSILIPPKILLSNWRTFYRRKTEMEQKLSGDTHKNEISVDSINHADSIKLIVDPYKGLTLEIEEKENGLWVAVNPEGYDESITVQEVTSRKGKREVLFHHVGWKNIPVNLTAHTNLVVWLEALEKNTNSKLGT